MVLIIVFIFAPLAILYGFFVTNLKLDNAVDRSIELLQKSVLPELMTGEVGFAYNGNIKICYELIKSDKPNAEYIVLLHGLTRTMLTYSTNFIQAFLDAGYHVVRIDNRDSGLSTWVKDWENGNKYTLEDMAADAMAVVDKLQITQFHLAGKSMGGMIAQCMAIQHPERVKTLTSIMSTGFFHDPQLVKVPQKFKFNFVLIYLASYRKLKTLEGQVKFYLAVEHLLAGSNKKAIDQLLVIQKALYELKHRNGFNKLAQKQHSYAIKKSGSRIEALQQLSTPTLVIHGKEDPLVKLEHGKKCAALIPNATPLFIEEMGHRVPKVYSKTVTHSMIQFLSKHKIENEMQANLSLKSN